MPERNSAKKMEQSRTPFFDQLPQVMAESVTPEEARKVGLKLVPDAKEPTTSEDPGKSLTAAEKKQKEKDEAAHQKFVADFDMTSPEEDKVADEKAFEEMRKRQPKTASEADRREQDLEKLLEGEKGISDERLREAKFRAELEQGSRDTEARIADFVKMTEEESAEELDRVRATLQERKDSRAAEDTAEETTKREELDRQREAQAQMRKDHLLNAEI